MQGMPMQGMPMQGMPMQGMPMQGMPMQGMPMQGMPMQGMPMQGMPMQGMPMQGMPMQGMHPQGTGMPTAEDAQTSNDAIFKKMHPNFPQHEGVEFPPQNGVGFAHDTVGVDPHTGAMAPSRNGMYMPQNNRMTPPFQGYGAMGHGQPPFNWGQFDGSYRPALKPPPRTPNIKFIGAELAPAEKQPWWKTLHESFSMKSQTKPTLWNCGPQRLARSC
eukprot:Lankesteria_metandrocarpae@DN7654_c0_g1_i1.p1